MGNIPKRIFFYWENDKISWMRYMTLYSFRKFNPGWTMDLFYDDKTIFENQWKTFNKQDFSSFNGIDYYDKIKDLNINIKKWDMNIDGLEVFKGVTPSGKSDIFKWYELYKNGGIFSDMDILYFKPIDNLYNHLIDNGFDTVICEKQNNIFKYLSVGFISSNKNNDFYKDIFNNCFKFQKQNEYQTYGVDCIYDLYNTVPINSNVSGASTNKYPNLKIFNLPFNTVYPFDSNQIDICFNNDLKLEQLDTNTIGYHWYAGHPTSQKYNNILTDDNYMNYNNLFCNICKEIFKL